MEISSAKASFGLSAVGTPSGANLSGTVVIGSYNTPASLSTSDVAYAVRGILISSADSFSLDLSDGTTSTSTAWVAGSAQVETATAAGSITGTGNASVVVTAAGMTGSPKNVSVAVTNADTAATWAGKVRIALAADVDVSAMFTVGGSAESIILTRIATAAHEGNGETINVYPANDGTLNISLDNGTCTGITTAASSANTTAGVATSGARIYNGGTDFEGVAIPACASVEGVMIAVTSSSDPIEVSGAVVVDLNPSGVALYCDQSGLPSGSINVASSAGVADFTITTIATAS